MPRNVVQDVLVGGRKAKKEKPAVSEARTKEAAKEVREIKNVLAQVKSGPRNAAVDLDEHPFFRKKGGSTGRASKDAEEHMLERRFSGRPPKKRNSKIFVVAGIAAFAGIGIAALFLFKGVTVTLTPKNIAADLDATYTATKTPGPDELGYDLMMLEGSDHAMVPAGSQTHVDKKASGTITITNSYSSASQKLIANTRFQTPEGLIYRIKDAVTIPGTTKSGGETVSGIVDVTVTAAEAGERYNATSATFIIPGFAGDPRQKSITATTKSAITGGFSGMMSQPAQTDITAASESLKQTLNQQLLAAANAQKPDGFQLYESAIFVRFDEPEILPDTAAAGSAQVSLHATLYGMLFNKRDLSRYVARQLLGALEPNDDLLIQNLDTLALTVADKDTIDPAKATSIRFSYSGSPQFVWQYDQEALRQALLGAPRSDFDAILTRFPTISKARAEFRPLGIPQTFPTDPKKITIVDSI